MAIPFSRDLPDPGIELRSERLHTVQQLLKAYTLFEKDVDYVIIDNKVKIVDEQTGRIMEGRRWSDGLHQAVEAKENVDVEAATQTYATITLQNYFRIHAHISQFLIVKSLSLSPFGFISLENPDSTQFKSLIFLY